MNLKTISAALDAAKAEVGTIQQRLADATTRRDGLLAEVQGIDTAIDGAELAHAAALAAVELGEADSTKDTAAALDAARAAESRKPELIQQRRTADAVIDGLTRRHAEAHGRYVALNEQHRAAQVTYMEDRAQQAMDSARDAIAQVANAVAEAAAVRRVLESIGGRWNLGSIEIGQYSPIFNPSHAAVELMAAALHNEIA
ncbi:MAG: hypothetical protein KKA22_12955 [Gammaproteobacteria bacterium]|nr:hypothetical protein [Gammaproteobacteria bacterium]MBU1409045.1 hypothetical protein [Gammaproteobacteria bacterium]MBU1533534.1 hypothetical protein [Gammaproteobacteria bacterium]